MFFYESSMLVVEVESVVVLVVVVVEVVLDLSSAAFIGALKRFISRRSCLENIFI